MTQLEESLFGIPLSTHRNRSVALGEFPYELGIAAFSVLMFRTTIPALPSNQEPLALRWFFGVLLGFLAFTNKSYELIAAVELFSYAVPICLHADWILLPWKSLVQPQYFNFLRLILIAISAVLSLGVSHVVATGELLQWIQWCTPSAISEGFSSFLPIKEVQAAYDILDRFVMEPGLLRYQVSRLLFVTFHIQCGIGYLGIDFLKEEQHRRNMLVRMDVSGGEDDDEEEKSASKDVQSSTSTNSSSKGTKAKNGGAEKITTSSSSKSAMNRRLENSRRFQRTAAPFILYAAVPYMVKIIAYGNLNAFAFSCFKDDIHRTVRLYDLFEHDSHLVAVAEHSATSPEAYADYMDTIVSTTYELFNRKIFSLPKVMLLPMVMARQPKMMVQIFPIIFLTDWAKGRAVSYMTSRIEQLQKEVQELSSIRSKVEAFDIKNAELLQRAGPGATEFTSRRWEELTVQVQMKTVVKDLISRTKAFFAFIQRNWVFTVLVDCALAHLIAVGKLVAADVFVFSRAIEDAVDMVLMKSRSEAELARMMTQIDKMEELAEVWDNAKERNLIHCNVAPPAVVEHAAETHNSMIILRNLLYSRGTAFVRVDHLELQAGIYALTGANGSGKSTLFRVLMSCDTNERSIDLPSSIVLSTPNEAIIETDDIDRELSCEAADEEMEKSSADDDEVVVSEPPKLPAVNETHPRLSITMPSSHVVEISQSFYWPLYTKPIDWIYQEHVTETCSGDELQRRIRRVAEELHSLEFAQSAADKNESNDLGQAEETILGIMNELVEEKEDWFSDMSGGQRSKVELTRTVFLKDKCPHVLLVDETMAPLDPRSKALVMGKLKAFCAGSVVIVIYHTDVGREIEGDEGNVVECVPSNDFFDANIHVENKLIRVRPVC